MGALCSGELVPRGPVSGGVLFSAMPSMCAGRPSYDRTNCQIATDKRLCGLVWCAVRRRIHALTPRLVDRLRLSPRPLSACRADLDCMKGSTMDAMSEAVDVAEVMLFGVSAAYKVRPDRQRAVHLAVCSPPYSFFISHRDRCCWQESGNVSRARLTPSLGHIFSSISCTQDCSTH
jgi:hypothetical protein